jgi:hypothetical protein
MRAYSSRAAPGSWHANGTAYHTRGPRSAAPVALQSTEALPRPRPQSVTSNGNGSPEELLTLDLSKTGDFSVSSCRPALACRRSLRPAPTRLPTRWPAAVALAPRARTCANSSSSPRCPFILLFLQSLQKAVREMASQATQDALLDGVYNEGLKASRAALCLPHPLRCSTLRLAYDLVPCRQRTCLAPRPSTAAPRPHCPRQHLALASLTRWLSPAALLAVLTSPHPTLSFSL